MSYCTNCGAELRPNAKFCTSCGAAVTDEAAEPQAAWQEEQWDGLAQMETAEPRKTRSQKKAERLAEKQAKMQDASVRTRRRGHGKLGLILIIVISVLLVADITVGVFAVVRYFHRDDTETREEEEITEVPEEEDATGTDAETSEAAGSETEEAQEDGAAADTAGEASASAEDGASSEPESTGTETTQSYAVSGSAALCTKETHYDADGTLASYIIYENTAV